MKNKAILFFFLCIIAVLLCGCSQATRISFSEDTYIIREGETITPQVNVYPKKFDYELSVSNETVAKVEGKTITGLRTGTTAVLTATSGDISCTAKLIVSDSTVRGSVTDTVLDTHYVTFFLANYADLGMESGLIDTVAYTDGDNVLRALPAYVGYFVYGWYTDGACTTDFDTYKNPVRSDFTLYCNAKQLENTMMLNGNDMISGILYPNLPHDDLVFPTEINGRTVKGIAANAFKGDTLLKTVTLPATYEAIGDFAFAGCVNLTTVTLENGSALKEIGQFAFSVTSNETTDEDTQQTTVSSNDDACKKLTFFGENGVSALPNSVSSIGTFAFGYCDKLVLHGIPSSLTEVSEGAFYGTKINEIDFTKVTKIGAFAFADCPVLSVAQNTQNVTECAPGAFTGTATYLAQYKKSPYVIYIDTIIIGCNERFGSGMPGIGKHEVDERTTLIADKAFSGKNQADLTLYVSTSNLLFGDDVFVESEGVCVAVPEASLAKYKVDNPAYRDLFCVKTVVTIDDPEAVNFGEHVLLKFSDERYYYDKYNLLTVDGAKRAASVVNIPALSTVGRYVTRINTRAFNMFLFTDSANNDHYYEGFTTLILGNTNNVPLSVATLAVVGCPGLTCIDLSNAFHTVSIVRNSFQFTTLHKDCKIYVSDIDLYRAQWGENIGTAYERLTEK